MKVMDKNGNPPWSGCTSIKGDINTEDASIADYMYFAQHNSVKESGYWKDCSRKSVRRRHEAGTTGNRLGDARF